jgi:hypothetical protein
LGKFANLKELQDIVSLIAYPAPEHSPMAYLLNQAQREKVANELNNSILEFQGRKPFTGLERLTKQCTVVRDVLYNESGKKVYPKWSLDVFLA